MINRTKGDLRTLVRTSKDEAQTIEMAADLSLMLQPGDLIALSGDLGAGKSVLCRGIIRALAGDSELEVSSPTYTLCNLYETEPRVAHFDLYRLSSSDEMEELGVDDALEVGCALIEWPERGFDILPPVAVHLEIAMSDGDERTFTFSGSNEFLDRIERTFSIRDFLKKHGEDNAKRSPFSADASARRYERVGSANGNLFFLMDAPQAPDGEPVRDGKPYSQIAHLAENVTPFVAIGQVLAEKDLGAPKIPAYDLNAGLVLIEDMGGEGVIDADRKPIKDRYLTAIEYLADFHTNKFLSTCSLGGGDTYSIPHYDHSAMMIEAELLLDWYVAGSEQGPATAIQKDQFNAIWSDLFAKLEKSEQTLVLRDFHSPNIIWRSDLDGIQKIGVIDFQDAVLGPSAYDVASLVQDARVDVSEKMQNELLAHYLELRSLNSEDFDVEAFSCAYAIMAAQRATKILGIFVRLNDRDGKPAYLAHMPRMRSYLRRSLEHPVLKDYRDWLFGVIEL